MMFSKKKSCCEVSDLLAMQAAAESLTEHQEEIVEFHLASCRSCLAEVQALKVLDDFPSATAALPLSEIESRRFIEQVNQLAAEDSITSRTTEKRQWFWGDVNQVTWYRTALAFMVFSVAVLFGVFLLWYSENSITPANVQSKTIAQSLFVSGRVLLSSGYVSIDGESLNTLSTISSGRQIITRDGTASLSIEKRIAIEMQNDTSIRIGKSENNQVAIHFDSGSIFVHVDPQKKGPNLRIDTNGGVVEVVGTSFFVSKEAVANRVSVIDGKIRLKESKGRERYIASGQSTVLGGVGILPVSEKENELAQKSKERLKSFTTTSEAVLTVSSSPQKATVLLDGLSFGTTPLVATISSGEHFVEVSAPGYKKAGGHVLLSAGQDLDKVFFLESLAGKIDDQVLLNCNKEKMASKLANEKDRRSTKLQPGEFLTQAYLLRKKHSWKEAVSVCSQLIEEYPNSSQAGICKITASGILLENLNNPKRALHYYNSYLEVSRHGSLTQEATFGRTRALAKMGRCSDEVKALRQFVLAYPRAIQTPRAKLRLEKLKCRKAE